MHDSLGGLLVYDPGERTLVGFSKEIDVIDDPQMEAFREPLQALLKENNATALVVDLSHIRIISSGTLGFFFSLHKQGIEVQLYNPSEAVREVLEITRLGELFKEVSTPH